MALSASRVANNWLAYLQTQYPSVTIPTEWAGLIEKFVEFNQVEQIANGDFTGSLINFELITTTGLLAGGTPVTQIPATPNVTVSSNLTIDQVA